MTTSWNPSSKHFFAFLPIFIGVHIPVVVATTRFTLLSELHTVWGVIGVACSILYFMGSYTESENSESPFMFILYAVPGVLYYGFAGILFAVGGFSIKTFSYLVIVASPFAIVPLLVYFLKQEN